MAHYSSKQQPNPPSPVISNPTHDPPAYSSPFDTLPSSTTRQSAIPGLAHIDFSKYLSRDAKLSDDQTTVTVASEMLCTNFSLLEEFVKEQLKLPPRPFIRIVGERAPYEHRHYGQEEDSFDLKLDLLRHISPAPESNRNWMYVKVANAETDKDAPQRTSSREKRRRGSSDTKGVDFWLRRFCADPSAVKAFTLRRAIVNIDQDSIAGKIRQLIASTGFTGPVQITFPVNMSVVVVQSSPKSSGLFGSLKSMFSSLVTKNYDVLTAVWPYATLPRAREDGVAAGSGNVQREYVLQSEEGWWDDWRDAIKYAVQTKRHGWVTFEDRIDAAVMSS